MADFNIGKKLRELRRERNFTLQDVATATGFSASLISLIESENVSPPIATLSRIAGVLKVNMGYFFAESSDDKKVEVVRRGRGKKVRRVISSSGVKHGYSYETLAYKLKERKMEPFLLTVRTKGGDEKSVYNHEGEEFLMVLKGRVVLVYGDEKIHLKEGDSVYFDSRVEHRLLSHGTQAARVLAVIA
ncbi:MAG TPA: cupin domain-containing protein [bacterium]